MVGFYSWISEGLILWVRQAAWFNSIPENKSTKPVKELKTRAEQIAEKGGDLLFPENPAKYLTDWLFDIGPTIPSSMGEGVIEYRDLSAWQDISGVVLMPWEASLLKRMSRSYLSMNQKASDISCPMPYSGTMDDVKANRESIDQQIKAAFANLKKAEK